VNRKNLLLASAILLALTATPWSRVQAEDVIEKAGVATGVTVGNTIAVPLKAVTMVIGALSGVLSFIVTGGDTEVTKQVWRDNSEGPYLVTPELARMSVGQRPELELIK
jgi:hypothetical protein